MADVERLLLVVNVESPPLAAETCSHCQYLYELWNTTVAGGFVVTARGSDGLRWLAWVPGDKPDRVLCCSCPVITESTKECAT